jgi:hypothetical protein
VAALDALLSGKSVTAAATAAGVSRQTVHRWLRTDPAVIAAWNAGRLELLQVTRGRLLRLGEKAVSVIEETLNLPSYRHNHSVRLRAAQAVLGMLGTDKPDPVGSVEADDLAHDLKAQESAREWNRMLDSLGGG